MKCELRKSSNLRNVVYEIAKLTSPVAVIVVDTTEDEPVHFDENLYQKFWFEMQQVFREVGVAREDRLKEDVVEFRREVSRRSPFIVRFPYAKMVDSEALDKIVDQLLNLDFHRLAVVWINMPGKEVDSSISKFELRESGSKHRGVDLISIIFSD